MAGLESIFGKKNLQSSALTVIEGVSILYSILYSIVCKTRKASNRGRPEFVGVDRLRQDRSIDSPFDLKLLRARTLPDTSVAP